MSGKGKPSCVTGLPCAKLSELIWQRVEARQPEAKPKKPGLLDTPLVLWTREEEKTANRAMQLFRNHDE